MVWDCLAHKLLFYTHKLFKSLMCLSFYFPLSLDVLKIGLASVDLSQLTFLLHCLFSSVYTLPIPPSSLSETQRMAVWIHRPMMAFGGNHSSLAVSSRSAWRSKAGLPRAWKNDWESELSTERSTQRRQDGSSSRNVTVTSISTSVPLHRSLGGAPFSPISWGHSEPASLRERPLPH